MISWAKICVLYRSKVLWMHKHANKTRPSACRRSCQGIGAPTFWGTVSTRVHRYQATAVCEHQASSPMQSSRQCMWSWHCPRSRKVHTPDLRLSALKLCSICLQSNYCLPTQPASVVTHTLALPSHYCIKSLNLITLFRIKFKPD